MTRGKQILEEAKRIIAEAHERGNNDPMVDLAITLSFTLGARWADKNPHWISVEDKLPKDWEDERLFALYTEPMNEDYSYNGRYRIGEYDGDKSKFYLIANNRWKIYGKNDDNTRVTHWMPLPQPPKGDAK